MLRSFLTWIPTLIVSTVALSGCVPNGFNTPRPTLTNDGLNSVYPDENPAFSADGKYLVFSSARNGSEAVYLYDTQSQRLVDLPNINSADVAVSSPDISGDGRYIVYLSNGLGKSEVFLYDRQTRAVQNISSRIAGDVRHPTISGNGRFIAFESNGSGQWDIQIFDRGADPVNSTTPSGQGSPASSSSPRP